MHHIYNSAYLYNDLKLQISLLHLQHTGNQYDAYFGQITEYIYYFDVANNNGELNSSNPIDEKEKEHLKKLTENKHIYWFKVD